MIYFDLTQAKAAGHRSGLVRVSTRLREELGDRAVAASWDEIAARAGPKDWFVTSELFSEEERPGFTAFLERPPCKLAAIFHDAIPLKFPEITWPKSVARHPHYMSLLAKFHRVFAVSEASWQDLLGYWAWQGTKATPLVDVIELGADFDGSKRVQGRQAPTEAAFVCVGIIEPRKNQEFLMDVCEALWTEGLRFRVEFVGRVNPHFGLETDRRIKKAGKRGFSVRSLGGISDEALSMAYAQASATLFPTIAEGCGLPLLESLWRGVPCLSSALPSIEANAIGGGCVSLPVGDFEAWKAAIRSACTDRSKLESLTAEAQSRTLPSWRQTAEGLAASLG